MNGGAYIAGVIGGWEVVLILTVVGVLLVVRSNQVHKGLGTLLGEIVESVREAVAEFCSALRDLNRINTRTREPRASRVALFVAQGFGVGRIPFAPGTFGSVLGIGWAMVLVSSGSLGVYLAGAVEAIAFSVWFCDDAEILLGKKDPGCVVLDEIIALPFCFLPWVLSEWMKRGQVMPPVEVFFSGGAWMWTLGVFVAFRVFDIWKPWPIRRLQDLPGGWGVTIDDLIAGVYVAALSLPFVTPIFRQN